MKPPPADWPRLSVSVFYEDPMRAIDWLQQAFGFTVRVKIEGAPGVLLHSELEYGGGLLMIGALKSAADGPGPVRATPQAIAGANTQTVMIHIDDVDAHCKHAREHGAIVVVEPHTSDYGDDWFVNRSYGCTDPEGHFWWFAQRLRDMPATSS